MTTLDRRIYTSGLLGPAPLPLGSSQPNLPCFLSLRQVTFQLFLFAEFIGCMVGGRGIGVLRVRTEALGARLAGLFKTDLDRGFSITCVDRWGSRISGATPDRLEDGDGFCPV